LIRSLGTQGIADFDPATGTPRNLGRLDGYLTGKSTAPASKVAMRYVRTHLAALGLAKRDLKTFRLARDYRDIAGIHHLSWTQSARGIPVFGNGLRANVTKDGRLISLQGSPVSRLGAMAKRAELGSAIAAGQARRVAAADVGGRAANSATSSSKNGVTRWANNDYAERVWFLAGGGVRLGYSTYVQAGGDNLAYQHVIDAGTGRVLYRHDTVNYDKGDALVFENYPGAATGGRQHVVNVIERGWLPPSARILTGPHVIAWSDVNDDDQRNPSERVQVPGSRNGPAEYRFRPFGTAASSLCSPDFQCSWNPNVPNSWKRNRSADVLQGFFFDNAFHDWLAARPFGFTPAAGNFSGDDPVLFNALDGANTDNGLPDGNHVDNANMNTPPDSIPPTMQMYLFHFPGASDEEDPFLAGSSAFDPSIILHEYTHGLSNRLVVDASGNSTLNSVQAGSMGEAWSDWYAQDYLVAKGLNRDTAAPGQLLNGKYVNAGVDTQLVRTMPIDCPVGTSSTRCSRLPVVPGGPTTGGYTYGEISDVIGRAEVHASGEVWGQTLWDLRNELGHRVTAGIVTRGMSLSPDDPSFLDMRNAILQADLAIYGGSHRNAIWSVFAHRGMGWFAGTLDGSDAFPAEDFALPPSPETPRGTVSGQVTDGITGDPVAGALVAIAGHDSGFTGSYSAITDASGRYSINHVLVGSYPMITAFGPGYELQSDAVDVDADGATVDFDPRRDWAASSGGGEITEFDGPDFSQFGCGPSAVIDLSQGAGWVTVTGTVEAPTDTIVPKSVVISLPESITLTDLSIDPTAACGVAGSASAGDFLVEASPDGNTWTEVASGTFTPDQRFSYVDVPVDTPVDDVSFVRYTIESPQVPGFATNCPDGAFDGCTYMSTTEVEVFGPQTE
jgi:hypothetical protein